MAKNYHRAAPVSLDVPLISNQEIWMNIALIKQYHENMPRIQAEKFVLNALQRLDLAHIAYKRNPALTDEERFVVLLLRAAMVKDALIIIDRPFKSSIYKHNSISIKKLTILYNLYIFINMRKYERTLLVALK